MQPDARQSFEKAVMPPGKERDSKKKKRRKDKVEIASEQSFPASDPPAQNRFTH